jgi:PDDEXK-like domain of unknown function (DUF3799)
MDCLAKLCKTEPAVVAPGIYFDMPRAVYDDIPALSASALKKWLSLSTVPGEFAAWLVQRWTEPESEPIATGRALDCMLLEPNRFEERFIITPDDAPRRPTALMRNAKKPSAETLRAIDWWAEFDEAAAGKTILTKAQNTNCLEMMLSLRREEASRGAFERCRKAVLVTELWGIPCKCETDLWNENIPHILDLKTAMDVRPDVFVRAATRFQYIEQAVFYLSAAEALGIAKEVFTFLVVRNSKPWTVMGYNFAPATIPDHHVIGSQTFEALKEAAAELVRRLELDEFANEPDWQFLRFPAWQVSAASYAARSNMFTR